MSEQEYVEHIDHSELDQAAGDYELAIQAEEEAWLQVLKLRGELGKDSQEAHSARQAFEVVMKKTDTACVKLGSAIRAARQRCPACRINQGLEE